MSRGVRGPHYNGIRQVPMYLLSLIQLNTDGIRHEAKTSGDPRALIDDRYWLRKVSRDE